MTGFTPAMEAALDADSPLVAGLLKIELPDATLCVMDGAGQLEHGGDTFLGRDPVFGSLAAVDGISDGVGDEAPAISFTFHPSDTAAAATLAKATMQGSPVTLWLAAVDRATGEVIPDPYPLFIGELDQPTLVLDRGVRELEYECVSAFERLFDNVEGARLADSFHQSIWPGETGLAHVTGIIKTIYWGVEAPRGNISYAGGGWAAGGGKDFANVNSF